MKFEAVLCQIVHIVRGGQPVRMSKRAGTYVTLRDLLEEVGKDAVRFTMLTRKADAQMEFDLDQVLAHHPRKPGVLRPVCACPLPFGAARRGRDVRPTRPIADAGTGRDDRSIAWPASRN